jgi:hypothetical protein
MAGERNTVSLALKTMLLVAVLLLAGCGSLVCRHKAMLYYSWAVEQGPARIVIYKVSGAPFYDAHAQAQIQRGGEWKYLSEFMGFMFELETPEVEQSGFVLYFTGEEFLTVLRDGHYHFEK